jgi:glucuronokinase
MIIRRKAYPRVGLIGNPSDGYFGKTIAFTFDNFYAQVVLYESPELKILPHIRDKSQFNSVESLVKDVRLYGYYGGIRLLKATIKRFYEYCSESGIALHDRNFTIRYYSNIPHMVGLAGSSAIITACLKALSAFYGVTVPKETRPNFILSVEKEELGISAGLQDRVAQVYQGLTYMDFDRKLMDERGYGEYVPLPPDSLPRLFVAYRCDLSEGSEIVHNDLRLRYMQNDPEVLDAIRFWANLTEEARQLLEAGEGDRLGELLDANFDRRASICRISDGNQRMIDAARGVGASAKFTGSGGAIVGTYSDEDMFENLDKELHPLKVVLIRPGIV